MRIESGGEFMRQITNKINRENGWKIVAVVGLLLIIIKIFIGQNPVSDSIFIVGFALMCSTCMLIGVYIHQPFPVRGWYMLFLGQLFDSIGNFFFCRFFYLGGGQTDLIFEAFFYALGGLFFLMGILSMVKKFREEISYSTFVNGLIITSAASLFIWVVSIKDDLLLPSGLVNSLLLTIFLAGVAMIIFVLSLIIMIRSGQSVSIYIIFTAGLVMIVGILNYFKLYGWTSNYFILKEIGVIANMDLFYPVGYLLVALAFLHPSLAKFKEDQLFLRIDANKYTINILGISFMIIPLTFLIQYFKGEDVNDLLMISSVAIVFMLVFMQVRNLSRTYYQIKDKNLELNNQNEMLKTLANIDHLTNLFNRKFLFEYGEQAIKNAKFVKKRLAFAMLNLDDFDYILERLGRNQADNVLLEISNRFLQIKRKDDIVIRYGGGEFIIIFDDIRPELDFENLMHRFRERSKFPVAIDGEQFIVTFSSGVAFMPDDGGDIHTLVEKTDRALNQARREGKEMIKFYANLEKMSVLEPLQEFQAN